MNISDYFSANKYVPAYDPVDLHLYVGYTNNSLVVFLCDVTIRVYHIFLSFVALIFVPVLFLGNTILPFKFFFKF